MMQKFMLFWKVELTDGTAHSGTIGVPSTSSDAACRQVAGAIRNKYSHNCEDVTVQAIGPA